MAEIETRFYITERHEDMAAFCGAIREEHLSPRYIESIAAIQLDERQKTDVMGGDCHDIYHVLGTTACINFEHGNNKIRNTLTGIMGEIERAKSLLEGMAKMKLVEKSAFGDEQ